MSTQDEFDAAAARVAIHDALARYARGIDRADLELARSAYHPDATDAHGGPFHGNAHEVMEKVSTLLASQEFLRHTITNTYIELHGDRANVESYHFSLHIPKDSPVEEHVYGRYLDVFEKRDGEWKILERTVVVDHSRCPPRTERIEAHELFVNGSRDAEDPSVRFFKGQPI